MADDDKPEGSMQQWAQMVLRVTTTTAVIVIAGFLVWRQTWGFETYADKMDGLAAQHVQVLDQHRAADQMLRRMLVVLQVMCIHGAKSHEQRRSCVDETVPY